MDVTLYSRNYTWLGPDAPNAANAVYTYLWANGSPNETGDNDVGGWANDTIMTIETGEFTSEKPAEKLDPGEAVWLCVYTIPDTFDSGTNGVIRIGVTHTDDSGNTVEYTGQDLICTTYAFSSEGAFSEEGPITMIPHSELENSEEAEKDYTAIRGSGNGAMMKCAVSDGEEETLVSEGHPYDIVLGGHGAPAVMGDQFLLSRYVDSTMELQVGENERNMMSLSQYETGTLDPQTKVDMLSYNPNFGVVYKLYFHRIRNLEGKNVVAKIKYTPLTNSSYQSMEWGGLHIAVWRVDTNNKIDHVFTGVLAKYDFEALGGGYINGVDDKDGVYYVIDDTIPADSDVTYYIAGCGMTTMPYELSFEVEP